MSCLLTVDDESHHLSLHGCYGAQALALSSSVGHRFLKQTQIRKFLGVSFSCSFFIHYVYRSRGLVRGALSL